MKVVMSGGGTAGHVYPALAVAARFAEEHDEVIFVGTPDGLEARLVPEAGIAFRGLPSKGFDRARPLSFLTAGFVGVTSAIKAFGWLGTERPDVVIGFGGYVSIPVGLAAVMRRIPLVLHEQNSVPGLANKLLSRWARCSAVTYEESARLLAHPDRTVLTGNPVREAVLCASAPEGRCAFGIAEDETMLLVFGGSRGARHLNTALVSLRDRLMAMPGLRVVHIAGALEAAAARESLAAAGGDAGGRWQVLEYVQNMGDALAAADVIVARAGATSIAEITALGKPVVLVPYPYATDDHQTKNAAAVVAHAAGVLVADAELDDVRFGDELVSLLSDAELRATMAAASRALGRADAADRVAALAREATSSTSDER